MAFRPLSTVRPDVDHGGHADRVWVSSCPLCQTTVALIERAERAGVLAVWAAMPVTSYDTPTMFAAALARTERIVVGTAIVPAFTRHPVALLSQAATLEALAPGRLRLESGPATWW